MHDGYRYIDGDGHVLEPPDMWERYLDPAFRDEMPRTFVGYAGDPYAYVLECWVHGVGMPSYLVGTSAPLPGLKEAYAEYQELGFGPQIYRRVLDRSGIDRMVVYPTVNLFVTGAADLSAPTAAAYQRAYNRWLHDFVRDCDGRVIGIGAIDLRDPAEAAREARRCVRQYGFKGVTTIPDPVAPHPWFHPFYDPLWAELQELDVPLAIHAGSGTPLNAGARALGDLALARGVADFALANMMASLALIAGGVLERFPRLRVAHLEVGCGWVPYWLDRMQSGIQGANRAPSRYLSVPGLSLEPIDYFRRQCFVACDPDDPHLAQVVATVGDQSIITATDFGHPEGRGYADAIPELLRVPGIPEASRRRIMWDNPARLYGLD
jgi:predicted TIM-barrel fold metal-dependent hydrolase